MLVRKAFHIRTYTGLRPHVKALMSGRASEAQGECRAEPARAMLSRSLHSRCILKCSAKVDNKKTSHKEWNVLVMVW